jgi:hypothetical protein
VLFECVLHVVCCAKLSLFFLRYLQSGFLGLAQEWGFVELAQVIAEERRRRIAGAHLKKVA